MRIIILVCLVFLNAHLAGCATSGAASDSRSLKETLAQDTVISLPYRLYGKGVFVVEVTGPKGEVLPLMVDTGATRSAFFESSADRLGLISHADKRFTIHGMAGNGERPAVSVSAIRLGTRVYRDLPMAVLEDRKDPVEETLRPVGLLGMDILADYRIFVDARKETFNFIPKDVAAPQIPPAWKYVHLYPNPFKEGRHDLHFMQVRMGGKLLPALLDTGSEINLMNWAVSEYPMLKDARRRLKEDWEINGAIGKFDPVFRINARNFRSGQKFWDKREFVVMNFEGLDILGVKDQPFMIAGPDFFADQTFYLDFEADVIRFKPDETDPERKGAGTVVVSGPRARS